MSHLVDATDGARAFGGRAADRPPIGIVIPAHDEAATITAGLRALMAQALPDDRIVVVCNGCSDDTAEVVRALGHRLEVAEIPVASKVAALNHGDALLDLYPRLYLDADVRLGDGALDALAAALAGGDIELAAPRLVLDTRNATAPVRQYLRIWSQLPSVVDDTVARGAYALSAAGRRRFDVFPDIQGDDHFVRECVPPDRRAVVPRARSTVDAAATMRGLLRRKIRAFSGNHELDRRTAVGRRRARSRQCEWLGVVRRDLTLLPAVPLYLFVALWPRAVAALRRRGDGNAHWDSDRRPTRAPARGAVPSRSPSP